LSEPFSLRGDGIEFVAGLALHPNGNDLVVSYGLSDKEAWISVISASGVASLLELECVEDHALQVRSPVVAHDEGRSIAQIMDRLC
jgi:hypothetical protein